MAVDCGATTHMFTEKVYFESLKSKELVTVGGHNRVPVVGWRSVRFQVLLDNAYREVILNEVLYIPQLGVNLVSLGLLQRSSSTVRSLNNGLAVVYMGEDLLHAVMDGEDGTLYFIECVDGSNHTALVMSSGSMCLWHRCMDHLSPSLISTMSCHKMVKGLELNSPLAFNHLCSGCMHGQSYKLPLLDLNSLSYSKMELVVVDLIGPMSIPTWDGNLYALVAVEVSCCYPVRCLLKHKEEVGAVVRDVVAMLERQSGECVKRF